MATLTFPHSGRTLTDRTAIEKAMADIGVIYEEWGTERLPRNLSSRNLSDGEKQAVLEAFAPDISRRSRLCGYQSSDVVTLYPDTPNLDTLLAKFDKKHLHTDDEVRFIVQGRGVFELYPAGGEKVQAELHPGDFITVPANYRHLFYLCHDRQITAIRLFTSADGWVANYVE